MNGLPHYRVKLDDALVQCALEELLELASQGLIRADTLIIPPFSEAWQAASTLIELSAHLKPADLPDDPWAAWDEMPEDDPSEDETWEDSATELELTPIRPPKRLEPAALTDASIVPLESPRPAREPEQPTRPRRIQPTPPDDGRGKVIAFPRERSRPATDGAYALAQDAFPTFTPPPPQPARSDALAVITYSVKWGRLIGLLGAGLALLAVVWFYVHEAATATFPPHPASIAATRPPQATGPGPVDGVAPAPAPPSARQSYAAMEADIRRRMSMDLEDISAQGDLEDAMYIELPRAGLRNIRADAEVLRWTGGAPDVARFSIRIRSETNQLDHDLGAVAIVIGKYIARYNLSVTSLDVILESDGRDPTRWTLNPESTRELWNQKIDLFEFLKTLR